MRICMLCMELPPKGGGLGVYVYNVARRLAGRGHEVVVITRGNWKHEWRRKLVEDVEVYEVRCLPIYPFHVQLHGIFVDRLLQRLQIDFDVVHLHAPAIPYLSKLAPYVATQHGTSISQIKMRKTRDLFSLALKLFQHLFVAMDRRISRNASTVVAISRGVAKELQQQYGISPEKVVVIPNGVDTGFFTPAEKPTASGPCVLYTGRLEAGKGIEDLVACAAYVCAEKPEAKFVVAGTGRGNFETIIRRKIRAANLDTNFQFTGFVNHEVLAQYYREASLCILPSYYEGTPSSLLEAMSCAIPCVATDIPGNSEVVVDNETGFLVPPRNPARLAEATLSLLNDGQLREKLGKNGRKRVLEYYDWNVIVDRLEELYRSNARSCLREPCLA